ncbi:hypothetical protein AB0J80_20995 [Actinoplanes sp. NPDC049548]|uniref:hypothetical protein n=1 Tax=Actinoplanes sp. NPDC049548 TaxID=3155152 RepID=UPI003431B456
MRSTPTGRRTAAAIALTVPAALISVTGPASAAEPAPAYALAATVSPAPLTAAECTDPTCILVAAPRGGTLDDYAVINAAITTAAGRTTPTSTATVLLRSGTYRLTKGLKLPPNVNLRGAGIAATTLLMDPTVNWKNFSYSFLVLPSDAKQDGSTNLVSDLTVNGNCRTGAGAPTPSALPGRPGDPCDFLAPTGATGNTGGGIKVGDRWTVRQVRFTNFEYFKLWVSGTKDARIVDNRFDNWGGAESDGEDNIGGGGLNDGTVIENNQYDVTARGNFFDFTNALNTTVRNNIVHTNKTVAAARKVTEYGNLYFEGVMGGTVTGNVLEGSHIVLQSNARYSHVYPNKDVNQPRDILVANNHIMDSATAGVAIGYEDYLDTDNTGGTADDQMLQSAADSVDHYVRLGGNNVVRDNLIERSRESGILVYGNAAVKKNPDTIVGNRVVNSGYAGSTTYNTGVGYFETAGIGVSAGTGDQIYGNEIVDDQARPTTWYGVQIGARKGTSTPTGTVLTGPAGETNTTTGIIASPVRYGTLAPEAPANVTATTSGLTWSESYATTNPIAGYRVYHDGALVADLPVGSAEIPANLLSADDASLENAAAGTAGWTPGTSVSLSRTDTAGAIGGASLKLTATGSGQISTYGPKVPVTAGTTYTSVASFQAGTVSRRVRAGLAYTDATGKVTRLASGNSATVDPATGWVTSSYSAAAPAGAVTVQAFLMVEGATPGETHLIDRMGLVTGAVTEQWVDPAGMAGRYDLVSYRAETGDNSPSVTRVVS